jgi:hypothetical protein
MARCRRWRKACQVFKVRPAGTRHRLRLEEPLAHQESAPPPLRGGALRGAPRLGLGPLHDCRDAACHIMLRRAPDRQRERAPPVMGSARSGRSIKEAPCLDPAASKPAGSVRGPAVRPRRRRASKRQSGQLANAIEASALVSRQGRCGVASSGCASLSPHNPPAGLGGGAPEARTGGRPKAVGRKWASTPEGQRYVRCGRCLKEKDSGGGNSTGPGSMSAGGSGLCGGGF